MGSHGARQDLSSLQPTPAPSSLRVTCAHEPYRARICGRHQTKVRLVTYGQQICIAALGKPGRPILSTSQGWLLNGERYASYTTVTPPVAFQRISMYHGAGTARSKRRCIDKANSLRCTAVVRSTSSFPESKAHTKGQRAVKIPKSRSTISEYTKYGSGSDQVGRNALCEGVSIRVLLQ